MAAPLHIAYAKVAFGFPSHSCCDQLKKEVALGGYLKVGEGQQFGVRTFGGRTFLTQTKGKANPRHVNITRAVHASEHPTNLSFALCSHSAVLVPSPRSGSKGWVEVPFRGISWIFGSEIYACVHPNQRVDHLDG